MRFLANENVPFDAVEAVILYISGYSPWNYARFLDDAIDRLFLQKVGGGYIFVHRLLMEHFAQMEIGES